MSRGCLVLENDRPVPYYGFVSSRYWRLGRSVLAVIASLATLAVPVRAAEKPAAKKAVTILKTVEKTSEVKTIDGGTVKTVTIGGPELQAQAPAAEPAADPPKADNTGLVCLTVTNDCGDTAKILIDKNGAVTVGRK